jgi:hypothetical protein
MWPKLCPHPHRAGGGVSKRRRKKSRKRRYIWSGTRYSEPYTAALALGIPGPLFQAFALAGFSSVVFLVVLALARSPKPATREGASE